MKGGMTTTTTPLTDLDRRLLKLALNSVFTRIDPMGCGKALKARPDLYDYRPHRYGVRGSYALTPAGLRLAKALG